MGSPLKMGIFAITTMVMLSIGLYMASTGLSGEVTATALEKEEAPEVRTLNWDRYAELETGMSLKKVVDVVGWEGDLFNSANLKGRDGGEVLKEIYIWENDDGSKMTCIFENSALSSKEEYNLQ